MISASSSSLRQMLLFRCTEATRYFPAAKCTVPPPSAAHFSIALLIAGVSLVVPSPVAPNSFTSTVLLPNRGGGMFGGEKSANAIEQRNSDVSGTHIRFILSFLSSSMETQRHRDTKQFSVSLCLCVFVLGLSFGSFLQWVHLAVVARAPRTTSLFASAGSKYSGGETVSRCTPIARIVGQARDFVMVSRIFDAFVFGRRSSLRLPIVCPPPLCFQFPSTSASSLYSATRWPRLIISSVRITLN